MKPLSPISVITPISTFKSSKRLDPYSMHPRKLWAIKKIHEIAKKNGWEIKELGQLVLEPLYKSSGTARRVDGKVIAVKPGALSSDYVVDFSKCARETDEVYEKGGPRILNDGDILLLADAHAEGYIGYKTSIIRIKENQKAIMLGHLIKVRPDPSKVNPYYLVLYLNTKLARYYLNYSVRGQSVGLYPEDASKLPVLIPPRKIQDEIGDKLKDAIDKILEFREKREGIPLIFNQYIPLSNSEVAEEKITTTYTLKECQQAKRLDPKYFAPKFLIYENALKQSGYPLSRLKDVSIKIHRGVRPYYVDNGPIPVIKTKDVKDNPINWESTQKTNEEFYKNTPRARVPKDALVITSTGEGSWGRTSVNTLEKVVADGEITIVEIDKLKVDPYYVCAFLWTHYGKSQYERSVKGSTGQTHLYPSDIEMILIPRLPKGLEEQIARETREVFELFYTAQQLKKLAMATLNRYLHIDDEQSC
ncbi:restriction endonuclease subunit S [Thermococcus sp. 21S9]|uniref:restriction endonuclease subunit S n=1 Tax=Thermococcus sp. 21S9 TaxID=1638223 RepID=UPI0014393E69|nr:restriction endonuclease subunit S [Thermococcus sp. 21S9]NJE54661.1 restriction endonuclease subunit S [Thermococcus sp. 21S9]